MTTPFNEDDPTPKVTPGKRPAASPKPAARGANQPAADAVGTEQQRLSWGHVGTITRPGRLSDGTSRPGVIRVVEANIAYHTPPLDPYVWSQASLNYVGQFEMCWNEGDPAQVHSLADLAADLRRGAPSRPQLKTLDNVADALLATAERLHERDNRLGLVHLGNVLVVPGSEGRRIILPDLGFVWRGGHGQFPWKDSPGRPRWLIEDPRENPNARLWDEEPVWQQFPNTEAAGDDQEPVPAASDLRSVARMFAAILTGRIERELPPPPNAAPVWGVLRAVIKGEITTAAEFRARLAQHPLSEHWLAPKPAQGSGSAPKLLGCLGLLAGGGALTAAALYFGGFFDKQPSEFAAATSGSAGPTAQTSSRPGSTQSTANRKPGRLDRKEVDWKTRPASAPAEIADLLKQLENAKTPREMLEHLVRLYQFYEAADPAVRDRIRPSVEYWRGQYVNSWESRYRQSDNSVIKNIGLRFDVGRQIHELNQELTGLRTRYEPISPSLDEREKACLLISELRSRELGSPR